MAREVELNKAIRDRVRRPFVLPRPLILVGPLDLPDDTSEESKQKLRAARAIPTARQDQEDALRAADRAARAQIRPPAAAHLVSFTSFTLVAGSSFLASVAGPFGFPFTIEEIVLTIGNINAAGTTATTLYTVLVSTNDSILLAQLQADTNIILFDPAPTDGIKKAALVTTGGQPNIAFSHPNFDVPTSPTFIKALSTQPAGVTIPSFHITINEAVELAIPGGRFSPPVGRTTININTAGAPTRGTAPATPRAARILVTQGGRIINERVIAWQSADPDIRADWFNRQVGGAGDPNIQWIP